MMPACGGLHFLGPLLADLPKYVHTQVQELQWNRRHDLQVQ
jgi:hypothetical protein